MTNFIRTTQFLAVILLTLPLSACVTHQRAYSPQDQTSSSRQKPWQRPYTVAGKRYEPLSSHEGFVQEGIASSYGGDFHGRKTSNGEYFDMNAMTAAHKTLPLGVYVKVRHKRSGREVVVRINDRGPFVSGRIIDLSQEAARRLEMIQEGVAAVKVTALGYRIDNTVGEPQYRAPANYDSGNFALQVAALKNRSNAYRYAGELKKKYGAADVQEAEVDGSLFYRVRLGHYTSLRTAQEAQESLERNEFPGNFIVAVD
ncbi:MAG: septal ring lytic transglycosylase RlpA family protein [Desulfuromonadaceae bacterium]|nr:septal ring lytic transglycosylase RlpA family protein [Desulfuromonadaceae bacterium]MDD2846987.1 septal ring lytic transglycosylase RlpA family protein [Desulfuromonadaceae bacterium]MDD4129035.1 septal ring lytic transglycosylase RlpA family protein [Desulfuromonadaceae bacterium]